MPTYADAPQTIANMYFLYKWSMSLLLGAVVVAAIYSFVDNIISKIKKGKKHEK